MKAKARTLISLLGAAVLALALLPALGEPMVYELLIHLKSAHGSPDGCAQAMANTMISKAPSSWIKVRLFEGETDTERHPYFHDDARECNGEGLDSDPDSGIDRSILSFMAAHSGQSSNADVRFQTLGTHGYPKCMRLGNAESNGRTRYFWMSGCWVLRHGPKWIPENCDEDDLVGHRYAQPDLWDGEEEHLDDNHECDIVANVYERWGPVLDPNVRMVCGCSSACQIGSQFPKVIWANYEAGLGVSGSWIFGTMSKYPKWVTPLCITTGAADVNSTPLVTDVTFSSTPNPSGDYLHIEYAAPFHATASEPDRRSPEGVPVSMPVFALLPMPTPEPWAGVDWISDGPIRESQSALPGRGPRFKIDGRSGTAYYRGQWQPIVEGQPLPTEERYFEQAAEFLVKEGWFEPTASPPAGVRLELQRTRFADDAWEAPLNVQKSVVVLHRRELEVAGQTLRVLGPGGVVWIEMNNDGSVLTAQKTWRRIDPDVAPLELPVMSYADALAAAEEQLSDPAAYELAGWRWGYFEHEPDVEQRDLSVAYEFEFESLDENDFASMIIEVPAQQAGAFD